jgi:hypothetical protein
MVAGRVGRDGEFGYCLGWIGFSPRYVNSTLVSAFPQKKKPLVSAFISGAESALCVQSAQPI